MNHNDHHLAQQKSGVSVQTPSDHSGTISSRTSPLSTDRHNTSSANFASAINKHHHHHGRPRTITIHNIGQHSTTPAFLQFHGDDSFQWPRRRRKPHNPLYLPPIQSPVLRHLTTTKWWRNEILGERLGINYVTCTERKITARDGQVQEVEVMGTAGEEPQVSILHGRELFKFNFTSIKLHWPTRGTAASLSLRVGALSETTRDIQTHFKVAPRVRVG